MSTSSSLIQARRVSGPWLTSVWARSCGCCVRSSTPTLCSTPWRSSPLPASSYPRSKVSHQFNLPSAARAARCTYNRPNHNRDLSTCMVVIFQVSTMRLVTRRIKWTSRRQSKPSQSLLAASEYLRHLHSMSDYQIATF